MKAEILKMLRESKEYVSGQQLCERLQVSRTAVWKVIKQLENEGYQIEAVRNRGYRIVECPDVLSQEEIESLMQTECIGRHVIYYEETDSTNTRIKHLAEQGKEHGTLAVADRQNSGKGRRGRAWESPLGENIYMSLLLRPTMEPSKAPMLTLVMAYSAAMAIREQEGLEVGIKWPNDLVIGTKKISGMSKRFCYRKIGIVQSHIFSDKTDCDIAGMISDMFYHLCPFAEIRLLCLDTKFTADNR